MRHRTLIVVSLLGIVLLSIHLPDDVVRGFDRGGPKFLNAVLILLVWAFGTLVIGERRLGHVIMLLGGIFAVAMPVVHRKNGLGGAIAATSGGHFFMWTLIALGVTGGLTIILAVRGLWGLRRDPHIDRR